jgi:DNA-binding Xre family transcriptional regulator|uniref:DUF5824 domain-containing protein n=1 Tax=viral metagenome TaxID=1070528 RepID=A0A6C0EVI6_9ZZZZ
MKLKKYYALKYLPHKLSRRDTIYEKKQLDKSRKLYTKKKYYTRKRVDSYPHKVSKHILRARHIYAIENITASKELAKKTGCSIAALRAIEKKGEGAYYSSGSRPNQSAQSWGRARLASTVTGGKAAAVDFHILNKGCNHNTSRAYKMALHAKRKHLHGTRRVPKSRYIKKG